MTHSRGLLRTSIGRVFCFQKMKVGGFGEFAELLRDSFGFSDAGDV